MTATSEPIECARFRAALRAAETLWQERIAKDGLLTGGGCAFAGVVLRDEHAAVAHLGDCRVYQIRSGRMLRRTMDHDLRGKPGVIIRAIGMGHTPEVEDNPDVICWDVVPQDTFLLTGGVHELVSDDELLASVTQMEARDACPRILELAMSRGGVDHQTVVIAGPTPL